jgi:hypothetical protein
VDLPDVPVASGAPTVIGTLRTQDDGMTVLFVADRVVVEGALHRQVGREVSVPTFEITQMEQREFRSGRTALAVAGGLGVLAALAASVRSARTPVELPPDPGHQEHRSPIFLSVPIGR